MISKILRVFPGLIVAALVGFYVESHGAVTDGREDCLKVSGPAGISACQQVLKKSPGELELLLRLGDLLMGEEQYKEATTMLKEAKLFHPDNKKVQSRLEMAQSLEAEWQWTEKQKAVILDQNARSKKKTEIKLNRIRCMRLKGGKGLTACDEALKALPDDSVLHEARGNILLQMGKMEEARSAFTMALRLDPDNQAYLKKLAALGGAASQESSQMYVVKRMALLKSLRDQGLITEVEGGV
jgi:tetratricopeptide (TPR) repeat protein